MIGRRFKTGVDLSGGQWQKIAIARAYMRDAQVMILDEPTAALDARSEFEVFQRFKELSDGKTAVLISHRFSSVRMADRILVLAEGRLEASRHARRAAGAGRALCRIVRTAGGGLSLSVRDLWTLSRELSDSRTQSSRLMTLLQHSAVDRR